MKFTWEPFDPDALGYDYLARWLADFYSEPPWHEHLWCSRCAPAPDDFGATGRYGISAAGDPPLLDCPRCGTRLAHFWSPERTRLRIETVRRQGALMGFIVRSGTQPCGWLWGYRTSPEGPTPWGVRYPGEGMYVDRIMVLREYRKGLALWYLLLTTVQQLKRSGCAYVITRTNVDAFEVRVMLKRLGFREIGDDPTFPGRSFWMRPLRGAGFFRAGDESMSLASEEPNGS